MLDVFASLTRAPPVAPSKSAAPLPNGCATAQEQLLVHSAASLQFQSPPDEYGHSPGAAFAAVSPHGSIAGSFSLTPPLVNYRRKPPPKRRLFPASREACDASVPDCR